MSRSARHSRAIGIDCSSGSCQAVVLSRRGSEVVITGAHYLSSQTEGFLSAGELHNAFAEWIEHNRLQKHPACCGLPQFQVNTIISDLPPVNSPAKMAQMVDYQTRHLGGLSGEALVNDFHPLPPTQIQTNPVLIALCRSSLLNEQLEYLNDFRALFTQFTGNGIALANAFQGLQPVAFASGTLQAVLDAGNEESILTLYYQRSLQTIAVLPGMQEAGSQRRMAEEAAAVIRRWQESCRTPFCPVLTHLWLSGSGAPDENLSRLLSETLHQVPISILGVPMRSCPREVHGGPETSGVYPSLTIAYGLALQALGAAPVSISLIPEVLAERKRRAASYPWLLGAWLLAVVLLSFMAYDYHRSSSAMMKALQERKDEIDSCLNTIPQLENAYRQIAYQQRRMLPIAEIGYRSKRYLETMATWQQISTGVQRQNWCIYMADEFSFMEANVPGKSNAEAAQETERKGGSRRSKQEAQPQARPQIAPLTAAEPAGFTQESAAQPVAAAPQAGEWDASALLPVTRMPLLRTMYAAGVVPQDESRYQAVRELQKALNDSECFENVDDYADLVSPAFSEKYLALWESFLKENQEKLNRDHTVFLLQLPFSQASVTLPLPQAEEIPEESAEQ